jgi:type 1 glutamine amidotransferase
VTRVVFALCAIGLAAACSSDAARSDAATDAAPAADSNGADSNGADAGTFNVLLFSRTTAFRHDSIPAAVAALTELGSANGYTVEASEDPAMFTAANLARFRVVVFLMTTGDVLDGPGQAAFETWIAGGGNYVGVHSAADTEYDWPFYGQLVGAYFKQHPAIQPATVKIEVTDHPATAGLPAAWMRSDEWYDFQANPRTTATVLATVDESTYSGGTMGADHPIVWTHTTTGGGRALYTAMGHPTAAYAEPLFRAHLAGAIGWAAGR